MKLTIDLIIACLIVIAIYLAVISYVLITQEIRLHNIEIEMLQRKGNNK